jgi:predicted KAP-like P-loop ATPase
LILSVEDDTKTLRIYVEEYIILSKSAIQPVSTTPKVKMDISVKLLTDKTENNPLLNFDKSSDVILNLIVDSDPKFSIGIYGEWGTGKTTLMKIVEDKLRKKGNIPVIWFNVWKYEKDKNLMIVSLLKAIVFGMYEKPHFKKLKRTILSTIVDLDKGIVDRFSLNEKPEDLFNNEKNSIYFEGLTKIENDLNDLRNKDEKIRIVVFIDDLDRCSPDRTAEIFESIKGILDIPGLVYVIGLSQETLAKFLAAKFKDSGIDIEYYIKKIIQMSIHM